MYSWVHMPSGRVYAYDYNPPAVKGPCSPPLHPLYRASPVVSSATPYPHRAGHEESVPRGAPMQNVAPRRNPEG